MGYPLERDNEDDLIGVFYVGGLPTPDVLFEKPHAFVEFPVNPDHCMICYGLEHHLIHHPDMDD